MAANDYLKVAAAQLKRAASQLKIQASQHSYEKTRAASMKASEISKHENEIAANKAAITQMTLQHDTQRRLFFENRVRELERQVSSRKAELRQINDQLDNLAKAKQRTADNLTNQARGLESQASSPLLAS
ncbi:MAG TPA: hypothetical protein VLG47_05705 [Candidatus Saccharimonadales bacterium]|nr:hypothetical protein [Candidatus Saccharimonadales bacterium]